jgi:type I restriction enzyme S subunit
MPFVLPPPDQLPAIVRFLDHADRRIRCFIAAKRRLIKLLNEQKQAIIQKAVTRGLNPNVRFKPSAVEWLGDVPEHWEVKRLKWVVRLQRGYDLPQDKRVPGPIPVVSSGGVIDMHSEHRALGPGVVMGRYGSTDAVFFIENDFWPHNTALYVTDFQGNDPGWCYYLLRTISKAAYAAKSAVPGVDRKDLYEIYVPQPARQEQVSVVRELEKQLGSVNSCIESLRGEIEVVREYNTRLISDVVTGKLDVCGVELPPLEEAEELPPVGDAALYEAAEEETDLEPVEERADSAD